MTGARISGERPWRRSRLVELGADPAAGVDWSVTVPAGQVWEVISAYASLVTDATVANRAARLVVGDGTSTVLSIAPAGLQVASTTIRYAWLVAGVAYVTGSGQVAALPRLVLAPGWTIGTATEGLVVGDNWSAPRLLVIETTVKGGAVDFGELPDLLVELAGPGPGS